MLVNTVQGQQGSIGDIVAWVHGSDQETGRRCQHDKAASRDVDDRL